MGTKNNPAPYDCYANAHPDEPMFVLLGRDAWAAELVRLWAAKRESAGDNPAMIAEARACADAMEAWCRSLGKVPRSFEPIDEMERRGRIIHQDQFKGW